MAEKQQGTVQYYGASGVLTWSGKTVTALVQSLRVTHMVEKREIKNSTGQTVGVIYPDDERLEATFEYVGSGATTEADALTSLALPAPGTKVTTGSFKVIVAGSFTDALNATDKWLYEGGGTINLTNDGAATGTITLVRYDNITPA